MTWDFFLNRFDALFVEAQVKKGVAARDLKNTNVHSEAYQKKITRAREALAETHIARSLSACMDNKNNTPYKRTVSAPAGSAARGEKFCMRQGSLSVRRKSTKQHQIPDKLQAFTGTSGNSSDAFQMKDVEAQIREENHLMAVVHGDVDDSAADDSMHLLITLMVQFLSRPDASHPIDEKTINKNQQLVLLHLNILLGYSPSQKLFLIPPHYLRSLPVFSAFITSMPKVLDFNLQMGNILLSTYIPLLVFCPSPQRTAQEASDHMPLYSVWMLKPHVRQSWLTSVMILLYKAGCDVT